MESGGEVSHVGQIGGLSKYWVESFGSEVG
jgi:hypothetical protein